MATTLNGISRKTTGIAYTFSALGIQSPQKFTTIGATDYPLVDAKNIDWNNSELTYIGQIKPKFINEFLGGDDRKRYQDSNDFDYAKPNLSPRWLNTKVLTYTSDVCDLVDYLLSRCIYLDQKVEDLENNMNKKDVNLIYNSDELDNKFGITPDSAGDILLPLTYNIWPNQLNSSYDPPIYQGPENETSPYRGFSIEMHTAEAISADSELFADGFVLNHLYSEALDGDVKIDDMTLVTDKTSATSIYWVLHFYFKGWAGGWASESGLTKLNSNTITFYAQTNQNAKYKASATREFKIQINKAQNVLDGFYINGTRYYYIPPNTIKFVSGITSKGNNYYIISENALIDCYGDHWNDVVDLYNLTNDQQNVLWAYMIGNPLEPESTVSLALPNDKTLVFEIYPRYYGTGVPKKFAGSQDPTDPSLVQTSMVLCGINDDQQLWPKNLDVDSITNSGRTLEKTIDGELRKGVQIEVSLRPHSFSGDESTGVLCFQTSSNLYVGANLMYIPITLKALTNIFVVDNDYTYEYDLTKTGRDVINDSKRTKKSDADSPVKYYGDRRNDSRVNFPNDIGKFKSSVEYKNVGGEYNYYWNVSLPIWCTHSWENWEAESQKLEAAMGVPNQQLTYPNATAKIDYTPTVYVLNDENHCAGFAELIVYSNYLRNPNDPPQLIKCEVKSDGGNRIVEITDKIELDYVKTAELNDRSWWNNIVTIGYDSMTKEERGKRLVNAYVKFTTDTDPGYNTILRKKLMIIHATINPATNSVEPLKIAFKIPANDSGSIYSDGAPLYNEETIILNLTVYRGSEEIMGWALKKMNTTDRAIVTKEVVLGEPFKVEDVINNHPFNNTYPNHVIQTRNIAFPLFEPDSRFMENGKYYLDTTFGTQSRRLYFTYNKELGQITFTEISNSTAELIYTIDDESQFIFTGIINADAWFEECIRNISMIMHRKINNVFQNFKQPEGYNSTGGIGNIGGQGGTLISGNYMEIKKIADISSALNIVFNDFVQCDYRSEIKKIYGDNWEDILFPNGDIDSATSAVKVCLGINANSINDYRQWVTPESEMTSNIDRGSRFYTGGDQLTSQSAFSINLDGTNTAIRAQYSKNKVGDISEGIVVSIPKEIMAKAQNNFCLRITLNLPMTETYRGFMVALIIFGNAVNV